MNSLGKCSAEDMTDKVNIKAEVLGFEKKVQIHAEGIRPLHLKGNSGFEVVPNEVLCSCWKYKLLTSLG